MESKLKIFFPSLIIFCCIAGFIINSQITASQAEDSQQSLVELEGLISSIHGKGEVLNFVARDTASRSKTILSPIALIYSGDYLMEVESQVTIINQAIDQWNLNRSGSNETRLKDVCNASLAGLDNIKAIVSGKVSGDKRVANVISLSLTVLCLAALAYLLLYVLLPLQDIINQHQLRWSKLRVSFQGVKGKIQSMSDDLKDRERIITEQRERLKSNQEHVNRMKIEKSRLEAETGQLHKEQSALQAKLSEKKDLQHTLTLELEKKNDQLQKLTNQSDRAENKHQELKAEIINMKQLLESKNEDTILIRKQLEETKESNKEYVTLKAQAAALEKECSMLQTSLHEKKSLIKDFQEQIVESHDQIELFTKESKDLQIQLRVLEQDRSFIQNRLEGKNQELEFTSKKLEESDHKIQSISQKNAELVEQNKSLEFFITTRNNELNELKSKLRNQELTNEKLEKENESLKIEQHTVQRSYFTKDLENQEASWTYDIHKDKFSYSRNAASLLGVKGLEGSSQEIFELLDPANKGDFYDQFQELKKGVSKRISGQWMLRQSGEQTHSVSIYAHIQEEGDIKKIHGVFRDITEIRETKDYLRNLSFITDQISDAIMIVNYDLKIEWINNKYEMLSGYAALDIKGKHVDSIYRNFINQYNGFSEFQAQFNGSIKQHELLKKRHNGDLHWVMMTVSPVYDAKGKLNRYIIIERDIDQLKKQQDKLSELSVLAEKTDNFAAVIDPSGKLIWNNNQFESEFGLDTESNTGFIDFLRTKGVSTTEINKIREAFNARRELKTELKVPASDEEQVYSLNLTPQVGANNEEFLIIGKDVTFEKAVAENYRKNQDELELLLVDHEKQSEVLRKKEQSLEVALKELEASKSELLTLNLLAERSDNMISITDELGQLKWANKQFENKTGFRLEELENTFAYNRLKGTKTDIGAISSITKSIRAGKPFKQDLFLQNKHGEDYYAAVRGIPVMGEEGDIDQFLIIESDLTTLKEAEEKLENLTSIADQITNAVLVIDGTGEIHWVNRHFNKISGKSDAQLLGGNLDAFIALEEGGSFLKHVVGKQRKINAAELLLKVNNASRWYSYSYAPITSNDFSDKYLVILNDVDESVNLKNQLEDAEARLKEAQSSRQHAEEALANIEVAGDTDFEQDSASFDHFLSAPVGVALIGYDGTVEKVNSEFCRIYGVRETELAGDTFTKLYPKGEKQSAKKQLQAFFKSKKEAKREVEITLPNGEDKRVLRSAVRIETQHGGYQQLLFLVELVDNTDQEETIYALEQEIVELKKRQVDQEALLTKEQELQRALEESQTLSLVASKTDNAVIITDHNGSIEYVNAGFERITGYKANEVAGKKPGSFLQGPDTDQEHVRAIRQGLSSKRPFSQEILNYSKSGKPYWLNISITPILDVHGNVEKFIAIERDITEQKSQEDDLRRLSLVASKTDNAVIITNKDGLIEYVNDGFERVTEYRSHEVIGKKPGSFLQGPDTSVEDVAAIRRGLKTGKPFKQRIYNYSKSGRGYWLMLNITPIFDEFGAIEKFIAIESDITEQVEAEEDLKRLSLVASQTDNAVIITDKSGGIEWVNEGFERLTEYRLNEVLGKKPGEFLQGEKTDPEHARNIRKGLNSGEPFTQEIYNYSKTGKGYWLQLSINPIFDDDGNIEKFIAIESDVTERKKLEEEIRESEEQMREIMDLQFAESEELMKKEKELKEALELSQNLNLVAAKTDNAVIITDANGRIQYVNEGFERITGYNSEEVQGKVPGRLLQGPDTDPNHIKAIREGLQSKKPFVQEILNYTKSGIPYWLQLSITPILDARGNVEKFIAIENDITERKKEEDNLRNLSLVASETDNAVIITDNEGLVIWVNDKFESLTEYTLEEVKGTKPGKFLQGAKTSEEDRQKIREGLASHRPFTQEIYNYSKTGRGYWLSLSITPIFNANGELEKFIAIESDITERKQLEDEIRESEEQMRSIMDTQFEASENLIKKEEELRKALELSENLSLVASKTDNAVIISSAKGEIQYVNEGFERITGYKADEVMGKKPGSFLQGPETNPKHVAAIRAGLQSKKPFTQEILNYSKRGVPYWLELSITPILDNRGEVEKFIAIESDITEKKAEQEQMEALSIVASKTDNAVIITDKKGAIEWVNDGFTNVTEYTLDEVVGKKPGDFLQGEKTNEEDRLAIREKLNTLEPFTHEIYNYSKSGRGYWLQLSISPIFDDEGKHEKFIAIESDITERKELEEELKNSESEMRGIMEKQFEAQEELIKKEKELNKALSEEKESREQLDNTMERLKDTQTQMVQNEKMASIGQLTAGIAHEINNPINFVYNGIDSLKMSLDDLVSIMNKYNELSDTDDTEAKLQEIAALKKKLRYERLMTNLPTVIEDIKTGANRTIEIVKGLRVFSRLDEEDQKAANINECLDSTLILLRNKTKDVIKVKKFYDQHVGEIMCYPGQLNQVFMNLMTNAIQAIPEERTDGELMIYTENLKDSIIIRILDNGSGIPEDVRKRIFEPFYTTKPVGIGTGLGLSISYGIIEKHEGKIYVNSEVGKGTEFVIELPKEASLVKK